MDKNKPFPECTKNCEAVKMLGVGECESVCGHKFDTSGRQLTIPDVNVSVVKRKLCPTCGCDSLITLNNITYCMNDCCDGVKWHN